MLVLVWKGVGIRFAVWDLGARDARLVALGLTAVVGKPGVCAGGLAIVLRGRNGASPTGNMGS